MSNEVRRHTSRLAPHRHTSGLAPTVNFLFVKPGKKMGKKLKELETLWVNNDFKISKEEIKKIVLN